MCANMLLSMNSDLQKLVQAGKIPADFATRLDKFSPGKYVMHQEMGVGKVSAWSLPQQKVKIAFEGGKDHVMGLKLAFNSLTSIPEGHFHRLLQRPQGLLRAGDGQEDHSGLHAHPD